MRSLRAALAVSLVLCRFAVARAEPATREEPRLLRVSGAATVTAAPDQADIDVGVSTEAPTAKEAAGENAKRADRVVAAVRQVLGVKADVKTIGYSVSPRYADAKPNRAPAVAGYAAENVIRVTTTELARVSDVIDRAIAAGANDVRGINFSLKNEDAARVEALRQAVAHARAEAEAIAAALGAKLGRVHSAESSGEPRPIRPMVMGAAMARGVEAPPTPVEPGTVEVHANVSLSYEIAD